MALLPKGLTGAEAVSDLRVEKAGPKPDGAIRIISCNILLASPVYENTPKSWEKRRPVSVKVIRDQAPDIICMQEVLRLQCESFAEDLPEYVQFGFPGPFNDAHPTGYHGVTKNVIMFLRDKFEMVSGGGFWLSETPLIAGSKSWDCQSPRHCNWVRLKNRGNGREFRVCDVHLDHKGQTARENQARMLMEESDQYTADFPQLLAGDFNASMKNPVYKILTDAGWTDTFTAVHGPEEPGRTFHGLKGPAYKPKSKGGKIDFIFCRA